MAEGINRDYTKTLSMFQSTAPEQKTTIAGVCENGGCVELSISMLEHFPDHPFELYDGERFEDLAASIKEHGVLSPVLVRKMDAIKYFQGIIVVNVQNQWVLKPFRVSYLKI